MTADVIKTAKRIFEVLEFFDEEQRPISLKQISTQFGYPASSASALLKSMVVMGYLAYDGYSRVYMPTMRIASLGHWISGVLFGEDSVIALVKHLHEATQETIGIATQSDLFAQYIHVAASRRELLYYSRPGTVRSLARSGLGWLLLSARSDEVIEKLWRRINAEEEDRKLRVPLADLMSRVKEIRKQGYVFSRNTVTQGAGVIGMLLPVRPDGRILSVGVFAPLDRLDDRKNRIVTEMRASIARFLPQDIGREERDTRASEKRGANDRRRRGLVKAKLGRRV